MQEPTDREEFAKQANVAVLATVGPGQRSHAMPIWYVYEDGHFVMSAGRGSQKVRNIERHGEATLLIDCREPPYYALMAQGRADIGPPPSDELRLRLAVRYLGEERGRAYTAERSGEGSVTIRLHPERLVEYRGVAGRIEDDQSEAL